MRRNILILVPACLIALILAWPSAGAARAARSAVPAVSAVLQHQAAPDVWHHPAFRAKPAAPAATVAADQASLVTVRWHPIPRWRAYVWALDNARGCPYVWGGNGPCGSGFDCSGLVVAAYAHEGIWLPRTTWEMLGDPRVRQIPWSQARAGDLVFEFSGGHVLMYTGHPGWGFGAHSPGNPSGFENLWSVVGVFHVTGAG